MNVDLEELFHYNYMVNELMTAHLTEPSERGAKLFSHILNAHHIWNRRIQKQNADFEVFQIHPRENWQNINKENTAITRAFLNAYSGEEMASYQNTAGKSFSSTVQNILFHVINHSNYHRAQINADLVQNGKKALVTDYILFKR